MDPHQANSLLGAGACAWVFPRPRWHPRRPNSNKCCRISERTALHVGGAGAPPCDRFAKCTVCAPPREEQCSLSSEARKKYMFLRCNAQAATLQGPASGLDSCEGTWTWPWESTSPEPRAKARATQQACGVRHPNGEGEGPARQAGPGPTKGTAEAPERPARAPQRPQRGPARQAGPGPASGRTAGPPKRPAQAPKHPRRVKAHARSQNG